MADGEEVNQNEKLQNGVDDEVINNVEGAQEQTKKKKKKKKKKNKGKFSYIICDDESPSSLRQHMVAHSHFHTIFYIHESLVAISSLFRN